ncbi:unnamed protein product [marine sediment metagenome]|uniref:Carbohydrate kinase PfkB domain-containing protein n=1 Tax=marine sediment metagenome TaxID=412755 RepID=X1M5B4_9ZZZZ
MVLKMDRLPGPGETLIGDEFIMAAGGKGANQAVAAARLGGKVTFIARVGQDIFGQQAIEGFTKEGISTDFIVQDKVSPSGVALIFVDQKGENSIGVASGANGQLSVQDVSAARVEFETANVLNPEDWKSTWFKVHRKWSEDIGSPSGVFQPFNIDAKINAAWVLVGLLYGNGDFTRTYEIATRCGDDADCNPASAGGILGAMKGYKNIPDFWKQGLAEVESIDFKYTTISLNDAYEMSYRHALQMIERNGGEVRENDIVIKFQEPAQVQLEIAFEGHFPIDKIWLERTLEDETSFKFEGVGFAVTGGAANKRGEEDYTFNVELYIDGDLIEIAKLPTKFQARRFYPFWRYQLPMGEHEVILKLLNPTDKADVHLEYAIVYGNEPFKVEY